MADQRQLAILRDGVKTWNEWIRVHPDKELGFSGRMLFRADLSGADLSGADLSGVLLSEANLSGTILATANLSGADLSGANLSGAVLFRAILSGANLSRADLSGVDISGADLSGANLSRAVLSGADLFGVRLGDENQIGPSIVDINLSEVNLNVVDWTQFEIIGDEYKAKQNRKDDFLKDRITRIQEYNAATRANRQLSIALAEQGLTKEAARFIYNGQVCERKYKNFLIGEKKGWNKIEVFFQWLFSLLLWLVAGYGYRFWRAFATYLVVIFSFGLIYWFFTKDNPKSDFIEAVIESINVFHGRGISTPTQSLIAECKGLLIAAGFEATVGLITEVTFIAALTQRLFAK